MTELVFFTEEPSARVMLEGILPRILPDTVFHRCISFEGKQHLEKRLPIKLKGWQTHHNTKFVVMRDQDSGNCKKIKAKLIEICRQAGKTDCLVRIACHELESFYLGDLQAVAEAIGPTNLTKLQDKVKYRDPDNTVNPSHELKRIAQIIRNYRDQKRLQRT